MLCSISQSLKQQDISEIQALEQQLGRNVLALSFSDLTTSSLSQEDVSKLQDLEKRLGVTLVAVENEKEA